MAADVSKAVSEILEALDLSIASLALILGASRQSIYRWRNGEPAEGIHEVLLTGVARELADADDWLLTAWKSKVKRALDEHGHSLESLRALVQRPPEWDAVTNAWRTLQDAPDFKMEFIPTTAEGFRAVDKLQKISLRVGERIERKKQSPKLAKPKRKSKRR